jgi:hypothetical protein
VLRLFLILAVIALVSASQREILPSVTEICPSLALDPVQEPTHRLPFEIHRDGVTYRVEPVADYELRGLVVSYHDSDSFFDVYHGWWGDKLNFRDLGVVWGHNALSGLYRDLKFRSRDFTLYLESCDELVWSQVRLDQVSNNHLLAADREVEKALREIGKGDQIQIRGVLCRYSHPGGSRGTSLTRNDRGDQACETVFVDSVTVMREANGGWRLLHSVSSLMLKLLLPVLLWQIWLALKPAPEARMRPGEESEPELEKEPELAASQI